MTMLPSRDQLQVVRKIECMPLQQAAHQHGGTADGPPASQAGLRPRVVVIVDRLCLIYGARILSLTPAHTGPGVRRVAKLLRALISFVLTFVDAFRHTQAGDPPAKGTQCQRIACLTHGPVPTTREMERARAGPGDTPLDARKFCAGSRPQLGATPFEHLDPFPRSWPVLRGVAGSIPRSGVLALHDRRPTASPHGEFTGTARR
jgi:hypothetical protein